MRSSFAPGKIILSGEHAVVYGKPAVAMAIKSNISMCFIADHSNLLSWYNPVTERKESWSWEALQRRANDLNQRYEEWQTGRLAIKAVLPDYLDLLIYTLAQALSTLPNVSGQLSWTSKLHPGAGMGSSAAFIAAVWALFLPKESTADELAQRVFYCERMQHGKGSLIDAASVSYGGCVTVQQNMIQPQREFALSEQWYWVFSGRPRASTGECVAQVAQRFAQSSIWTEFEHVTQMFLSADDTFKPEYIRANHQLLCRIGVVPETIQQFIKMIEVRGGAAKVCGAGSLSGKAGGLLLLWLPEGTPADLRLPAGYTWGRIELEHQGAQSRDY